MGKFFRYCLLSLFFLVGGWHASFAQATHPDVFAMEYFFDVDPGFGNATSITISPASPTISLTNEILTDAASLSTGFHIIGVRVQNIAENPTYDVNGDGSVLLNPFEAIDATLRPGDAQWGMTETRLIYVDASDVGAVVNVNQIEYFFDTDPGVGAATQITAFAASNNVSIPSETLITSGLSSGFHILGIRARTEGGEWGITETRLVFVDQSDVGSVVNIDQIEYFFDEDPGVGSATQISTFITTNNVSLPTENLDASALASGFHVLGMRARTEAGEWGITETRLVYIDPSNVGGVVNIDQIEYFFDTDPGVGSATLISDFAATDMVSLTESLDVSTLVTGFHVLGMRGRAEGGNWGMTESRLVYVDPSGVFADITEIEVFIDTDPGVGLASPITIDNPGQNIIQNLTVLTDTLTTGSYSVYARVKNSAGEWGITESSLLDVVNLSAPIITSNDSITNTSPASITISFDEAITGFGTADIEVSNGTVDAGSFVDNGDNTFDVDISLSSEGVVLIDIADSAALTVDDNTATPNAKTFKIYYDLTAPTVAVNSTTSTVTASPELSGTVDDDSASVVVNVNGLDYTAVITSGTWVVAEGTIEPLSNGTYNVTATITDIAGNSSVDETSGELIINLLDVSVDQLVTVDPSPSLSGFVSEPSAEVLVTIEGASYIANVAPDGSWSIPQGTIDQLFPGVYDVIAGIVGTEPLITDTSTNELEIVALSVTVDELSTFSESPAITGTVTSPDADVTVQLNEETFTASNIGDGTWIIPSGIIGPLPVGTYDVVVMASFGLLEPVNDATTDELEIQAIIITVDPLITVLSSPEITGTVNESTVTVTVTINESIYEASVNDDNTWVLAEGTIEALAPGIYDVVASAFFESNAPVTDETTDELIVEGTEVFIMVDTLITNNPRPSIAGNVFPTDAEVTVSINEGIYTATVNPVEGTWNIEEGTINPPLVEGIYDVIATAISNEVAQPDTTTNELTIDLTAPVVTINFSTTTEVSPEVSGHTSEIVSELTVVIDGNDYSPVLGSDSSWSIPAGIISPDLKPGERYDLTATTTDLAGNSGGDSTTNELFVSAILDITSLDLEINNPSPSLFGTINSEFAGIQVIVNNDSYEAKNNLDGTWTLDSGIIVPLSDGTYKVLAIAIQGESSDTAMSTLVIDTQPPVITVDITATSIRSPSVTGTIDDNEAIIRLTIDGNNYEVENKGTGIWELAEGTISPELSDGTYNIIASAIDLVGNIGFDESVNELMITNQLISLPASQVTSSSFRANWGVGADVEFYLLEVSTDDSFESFLEGYQNFISSASSAVVEGIDFDTEYFYRVRFVNSTNDTSAYTNVQSVTTSIDPATLADFNALQSIYNATAGPEWTNQLNWFADRLQEWENITLEGQRIIEIDLSGNNLKGTFPLTPELDMLRKLDISENALESIENLSQLPSLISLDISGNNMEFNDLEPLISIPDLNATNQAPLFFDEHADVDSILVKVFNETSLTISTPGAFNRYKFFFEGEEVSGNHFVVSENQLEIQSIDFESMGRYSAQVTNTTVDDVVIQVSSVLVLATANLSVNINEVGNVPANGSFNGHLLTSTVRSDGKGYDTLVTVTTSERPMVVSDLVLGDYLWAADGDPVQYVPSYFPEGFLWEEADVISLRNDIETDMIITKVPPVRTEQDGEGLVGGEIFEDFDDENERVDARRRATRRKCGLRRRTSSGRTQQEDFELIAYGETNDNGEFEYGFLPQGVYRFFVEYPGIPMDQSSFVEFEVGEEGIDQSEFQLTAEITEDGIVVSGRAIIVGFVDYFKNLMIYPNPVSDFLKVQYRYLRSADVSLQLVDMAGDHLWKKDLAKGYDGSLQIDVKELPQGVYFLYFLDKERPEKEPGIFKVIVNR